METRTIKKVCVVGAGIMGRQIALNAAVGGYETTLCDSFAEVLGSARDWAAGFMEKSVQKGKMTRAEADQTLARLRCEADLKAALAGTDLVIEAIVEKEDAKRTLFETVNAYAPPDAIITSNSSYMPSSQFIPYITNPSRLANLHYFNPAMLMKLVEIVSGEHTGAETVEALKQFVKTIGKTYILVHKEISGFVVNRLLRALQNEAFFLLENGIASFEDIDLGAEKGLNHPMGPFRLNDLTGLDITYFNRQAKYEQTQDPVDAPPKALTERYERGEFGKKTGKGWYTYES